MTQVDSRHTDDGLRHNVFRGISELPVRIVRVSR